jgi:TM2 domain-containing membrane protein YozV
MNEMQVSREKQRTMVLLCRYLGWFGVHRFYTGKPFTGILMLLTLGGLGIWVHIDLGLILTGKFTDKEGKPITDWS